jgi:hypothetical protein
VLQGLGGGGLAPSEQSILADSFPPKKRGMAFALYGVAVVVAPAVGPALSRRRGLRFYLFQSPPRHMPACRPTKPIMPRPSSIYRETWAAVSESRSLRPGLLDEHSSTRAFWWATSRLEIQFLISAWRRWRSVL